MKIEIEIRDITAEEVVQAVAQRLLVERFDEGSEEHTELASSAGALLERAVEEAAARLVENHAGEAIRARVSAALDEALTEGWRRTDSFGNPQGERVTLRGRIEHVLSDRRGYGGKPWIEERIETMVHDLIQRDMSAEFKAIKERFSNQVNKAILDQFAATVRKAMGL